MSSAIATGLALFGYLGLAQNSPTEPEILLPAPGSASQGCGWGSTFPAALLLSDGLVLTQQCLHFAGSSYTRQDRDTVYTQFITQNIHNTQLHSSFWAGFDDNSAWVAGFFRKYLIYNPPCKWTENVPTPSPEGLLCVQPPWAPSTTRMTVAMVVLHPRHPHCTKCRAVANTVSSGSWSPP